MRRQCSGGHRDNGPYRHLAVSCPLMSGLTPPTSPQIPPPLPAYQRPPRYEPAPAVPFTVGEALSRGWETAKRQYGTLLAAILACFGITIVVALVPGVGGIAGIFLAPLTISLTYMVVRIDRGREVRVSDMFSVFGPKYLPLVGLNLLVGLTAIVGMIPVMLGVFTGIIGTAAASNKAIIIAASWGVGGAFMLAGWIIMVYATARLTFALYLYMDAPEN